MRSRLLILGVFLPLFLSFHPLGQERFTVVVDSTGCAYARPVLQCGVDATYLLASHKVLVRTIFLNGSECFSTDGVCQVEGGVVKVDCSPFAPPWEIHLRPPFPYPENYCWAGLRPFTEFLKVRPLGWKWWPADGGAEAPGEPNSSEG